MCYENVCYRIYENTTVVMIHIGKRREHAHRKVRIIQKEG